VNQIEFHHLKIVHQSIEDLAAMLFCLADGQWSKNTLKLTRLSLIRLLSRSPKKEIARISSPIFLRRWRFPTSSSSRTCDNNSSSVSCICPIVQVRSEQRAAENRNFSGSGLCCQLRQFCQSLGWFSKCSVYLAITAPHHPFSTVVADYYEQSLTRCEGRLVEQ